MPMQPEPSLTAVGISSLAAAEPRDEGAVKDERLRLIFTCCHPALAPAAQVALTLRRWGA